MLFSGDTMIIYLDQVWLLNSVVDYLLLVVCGRLTSQPIHRKRILLAGAMGGAMAVLSVLPGWGFLGNALWVGMGAGLLTLVAFGMRRRTLWLSLLLLLLTAGFAGVVVLLTQLFSAPDSLLFGRIYYPHSLPVLVLTAGVSGSLLLWGMRQFTLRGGQVVPVTVTLQGKTLTLRALQDTGNTLRDPISGLPVMVVGQSAGQVLPVPVQMGQNPEQIVRELYMMSPQLKPRLIPYRAVGVESGMLPAIRPEEAIVNGKPVELLLGLSPTPVSDGGTYDALLGGCYD